MLLHLYLIFSVDKRQYSRPLHMQAHVPSHTCTVAMPELSGILLMHREGRGGDKNPRRGRWDMQTQTCFPTGAQCQLSLHPAAGPLGQLGCGAALLKAMGLARH